MSNARTAQRTSKRETVRRADEIIRRYQLQVRNQVESINRLLQNPDAAAEIERLHARVAVLEQALANLIDAPGDMSDAAIEARTAAREALAP